MYVSRSCNSACAALLLIGFASVAMADTPPSKPAEPLNTTITSQKMTVRNQENKAVFEGAVVLTHGPLVVHSDMMVVSFKSVGAGTNGAAPPAPAATESGPRGGKLPTMSNRSVSLIEATGRVKIYKEDGQATCRKAVYHGDEEKLVLTGDPVAWQKGAKVSGKKITMYLAEDRSVVEGESRVMIQQEAAGR